jgi:hypothetical protein
MALGLEANAESVNDASWQRLKHSCTGSGSYSGLLSVKRGGYAPSGKYIQSEQYPRSGAHWSRPYSKRGFQVSSIAKTKFWTYEPAEHYAERGGDGVRDDNT